ncbi:amidase [Amycolatopsis acidicola]|uniref:Amidase n=1 Tax=Amycolatopsis acidicola TaxID=2596893 RepID=A0A5N0VMB2_9PSEU|nr:amidase [Amycolatopsis acidicola]KAA9166444.1 amidase [Amycolatopsis acidicola]
MSAVTDVRGLGTPGSAGTATRESLDRIRELDPALHAFLTVCADRALDEADTLDANDRVLGPMHGIPFSVKDTYATRDVRTTYGSAVFAGHVPERDAPVVARIREAGGVLVGKTNTPEFAIYIRTLNELQPETVNPWDRHRICGGSSGGAAASVAAGLTPVALGSDGGGSVRIPAALCGVVGLKPSHGAVSAGGGFIGTRRFSVPGPLALRVRDARAMWQAMRGPVDAERATRTFVDRDATRRSGTTGWRLRWVPESGRNTDAEVVAAVRAAVGTLAELDDVDIEETQSSLDTPRFAEPFYDAMMADRLATGGDRMLADPAARALLAAYTRHHLERAAAVTGTRYSESLARGDAAADHLDGLLDGVDFLVTPTTGTIAPEGAGGPADTVPEDARRELVAYTFLANYTGYPAITVPCGTVSGMPVGLQVLGRPGAEDRLLDVAEAVQEKVFPPRLAPWTAA